MTRTPSMTRIFTLLLIILFSSMALTPAVPVLLSPTPGTTTSTPSATRQPESTVTTTPDNTRPNSLEIQAGHSDWIVTIAILIVAIIIIPMLLKRIEPRGN